MLNHDHVIELLPAYALGSLDEEEAIQVAEHLATCRACQAELLSYQAVADQLALAVPAAVPPSRLKQQILGQLQTPGLGPTPASRPSFWQRIAGLFQRAAPAWGIAALALIALLVLSNLWWWQRTTDGRPQITPGGMQVIAMAGTEAAPAAVGTLVISGDGEYGTLVVDGLPPLDKDHQYQLWLIRDGQRTSGGMFSVNLEGYGALWIASPEPLSSYPDFGITIEPQGGSPGPTGDKVLGTSS
jgi:anti-sigma-K factor RskA